MPFPQDFVWGVATASYQVEGSPTRVGGGESVWDMFCRRPGKIHDASSGEVACDHYNRYREDVGLMSELGVQAYRFSISWPRVIPDGTGAVCREGLDFYSRLVEELLKAGIEPHATLFHWDFPYELYLKGGWLNRDSVEWFADYCQVIVDALGDRVGHWMTLNEPQCFIGLGLLVGQHAPGDQIGFREALQAAHHSLMAHGRAVQVIRARGKRPSKVGYAPVGVVTIPASESPEDILANRKAMFGIREKSVWNNTWWNDPVILGGYPDDGLELFKEDLPQIKSGDMELMKQPIDFFGCNIYNGHPVQADAAGEPELVPHHQGMGRTLYQWPVTPTSLYWGPKEYWERYHLPIAITENGVGLSDWVALDGKVHDAGRIDFLNRYIREFERAIDDGVQASGYFQWSFMDNFEWQEGYRIRFGLVYVDYQTQQRVPKDSYYWYKKLIQSRGASLRE